MATKRPAGGNRRTTSGGSKNTRVGASSPRSGGSGGGGGFSWGSLLLYPLVIAGGAYVGVQVYSGYQHATRPREIGAGAELVEARRERPTKGRRRGERRRANREQTTREASAREDSGREETHRDDAPARDDRREASAESPDRPEPKRDSEGPEASPSPVVRVRDKGAPAAAVGSGEASGSMAPSRSVEPPAPDRPAPEGGPELPPPAARDPRPQAGTRGTPAPGHPSPVRPAPQPAPAPRGHPTEARPVTALEVDRGSVRRQEVALTFDAGSDFRPVKKILQTLAAEGIHTTFFLTGEWVRKNPATARKIVEEGHEVGNHSWNHPAFTHLSDEEIRDQLRRTEAVIQETTGRSSRPFFRPPLGDRDSRVRRVVSQEGFQTIYWTLDSRDSVDRGITAEQIRERVVSKIGPGSIVLMHCGSQASADALPEILRAVKAKGLTPVPISRLIGEE